MNKRVYSTRRSYERRPARRGGGTNALGKLLNRVFVWALVVVNVALIVFLLRKIFVSSNAIPTTISPSQEPIMTVEVLNGCGTSGVANTFSEYLKKKNYDVVRVDNADSFDYEKSVILDRGKQPRRMIEQLCKVMGISKERILLIESTSCPSDATLIIGSDYKSLKAFRK